MHFFCVFWFLFVFAADSFLLFCFSGESVCDFVFVFLLQKYTFFVQADVISTAFVLVQKVYIDALKWLQDDTKKSHRYIA